MRVAKISLHTSPYTALGTGDGGGMNVVVREQAESLAQLGHQVELFTRRDDPETPDIQETAAGVRLHTLDAGPAKPLPKSRIDDYLDQFTHGLRRRLRELEAVGEPVALIHSHHWMSGVAALPVARELGVPHLQSYHSIAALPDHPLSEGEPAESVRRVPGEALIARESDLVVAVSEAEKRTIVERCGGDPARIQVLYPGVDTNLFRPIAPGEQSWRCCDMGRPYLLFAARLQPLKGPDLALEALALIDPEIRPHLVIAGEVSADFADYHTQIERLAHGLGVAGDVIYSGSRPRPEFAAMMRGAKLVLVPSHSETFGLVALEGAASGVPVVASAAGGLVESVQNGRTGVIMPTREPQAWADVITRLLSDRMEWERLSFGGLARVQGQDWLTVSARLADIYATQTLEVVG
ncbi:glycosyltransferase [Granulicoccus sp. GXG6511]|uniref:glycosyltransferase n=1 Tax=Granulicoccus sp. GXG6511 TaxID=3381351 RepID=UPI003D7D9975